MPRGLRGAGRRWGNGSDNFGVRIHRDSPVVMCLFDDELYNERFLLLAARWPPLILDKCPSQTHPREQLPNICSQLQHMASARDRDQTHIQ